MQFEKKNMHARTMFKTLLINHKNNKYIHLKVIKKNGEQW